ncbi:MAG: hypothetical protein PHW12_05955 [Smithella sp.]|nr:hypothetical protein [Smithella sp.]MDD5673073.1 hypothetical protein [Chitinivibrionales bacterium]
MKKTTFNPKPIANLFHIAQRWITIKVVVEKNAYSKKPGLKIWNNELDKFKKKALRMKIMSVIHSGLIRHGEEGNFDPKHEKNIQGAIVEDLAKWNRYIVPKSLPSLIIEPGKNRGRLIEFSSMLGESLAAFVFQARHPSLPATMRRLPESNDSDVDFLITDKIGNIIAIEAKGKKNGVGCKSELKKIKKSKKKRPASICYTLFTCYKTVSNTDLQESYLLLTDPPTENVLPHESSVEFLVRHYISILSIVGLWSIRKNLLESFKNGTINETQNQLFSQIPRPPIKASINGELFWGRFFSAHSNSESEHQEKLNIYYFGISYQILEQLRIKNWSTLLVKSKPPKCFKKFDRFYNIMPDGTLSILFSKSFDMLNDSLDA